MYRNTNNNIEYYTNTNGTIFFIYNKIKNKIEQIFSSSFNSTKLSVEHINKKTLITNIVNATITEILEENNFVKTVSVVVSTVKPVGYFEELNEDYNSISCYFNLFTGSTVFSSALFNNKYKDSKDATLKLLKKETPTINYLLRNLFHNESDKVLLNFVKYLRNIAYTDKRQDIMYLFFGKDEINEGQGAGKGVLQSFLNKMLSGLITSVSNETYSDKFNSNLQNKKVVIYDEVDLKKLNYNVLKNITGSEYLRIEAKGKDSLEVKNISSWLLFTNLHKLNEYIKINDRRMFLINPNPINDSLRTFIINKKYDSYEHFEHTLFDEIENFIHILASIKETQVLKPLELMTNTKIEYFNNQNKTQIEEIKDIYKIFTNKQLQTKLISIINHNSSLYENNKEDNNNLIEMIKLRAINFKLFQRLFSLLQGNGFISKSNTVHKSWEILKEKLLQNKYKVSRYTLRETKKYNRYSDSSFIKHNDTTKLQQKKINDLIREIFCKIDS